MSDSSPPWSGLITGHAVAGAGPSRATVTVALGNRAGAIAPAWLQALVGAAVGYDTFVAMATPTMSLRPETIIVGNTVVDDATSLNLLRGPAHAGISSALISAIADEMIPGSVADDALVICSAHLEMNAKSLHADLLYENFLAATTDAIDHAVHRVPSVQEVLAVRGDVHNAAFNPREF